MVARLDIFEENAPAGLTATLLDAFSSRLFEGEDTGTAKGLAYREARLAGWFKTKDGWQQVGPDVRDKVNIRKAIKQPNGTYLIQDVDVFYPNATKATDGNDDLLFSPEKIARAIENTNRMIQAGGQPPGLAKAHPNDLADALGTAQAFGRGINFRPSPRGKGWVRCDLMEVDPEVVEDWRKGKWLGLSAGFVSDANDLNLRFGHIAVLGSKMQSLSSLPMMEVYEATPAVCFSADPVFFDSYFRKGRTMKITKESCKAYGDAFAALNAAYASVDAGEPGSDTKLSEAQKMYDAAVKQFGADEPPAAPPAPAAGEEHGDADEDIQLINDLLAGEEDDGGTEAQEPEMCGKKRAFASNPSETTVLPEGTQADQGTEPSTETEIPGNKGAAFAAEVKAMRTENAALKKVVARLVGRQARVEFSAYLEGLRSKGHDFNADDAMSTMVSLAGNPAALATFKKTLESTRKSLLSGEPTFAAGTGSSPANSTRGKVRNNAGDDEAAVDRLLRQHCPGMMFSAQDKALGATMVNF